MLAIAYYSSCFYKGLFMKKIFWLVSALICSAFIASCVHGTSAEPAGIPSIKLSPENQSVVVGGSYVVTLTLLNYTESATIAVSVASDHTNIATVSPASCNLSKTTTTCNVTITAESTGLAQITAAATGYSIEPATVTVFPPAVLRAFLSSLIFESFSGVTYAYATDNYDSLYQCSLNSIGDFTSCTALTPPGFVFNRATMVQFESFGCVTYAYIADTSQNLWQCRMNATGGFDGACIIANPDMSFYYTIGITFASFGGVTYGYVANNNDTIWQCPVNNATGQFNGSCFALKSGSGTPFNFSSDITFASFNGVTYGYVNGGGKLWQCQMDVVGRFSSQCAEINSPALSPAMDIVFEPFAGVTYGYLSIGGNQSSTGIWQCPMNANGGFSSDACTQMIDPTISVNGRELDVTFESFSGIMYGYFRGRGAYGISKCPMNATGQIGGKCVAVVQVTP